eukprot:m.44734 g.44734  ORF g.44734 m.44734 type:complete len:69 (+) comp7186_c0_seq4:241-447(+)
MVHKIKIKRLQSIESAIVLLIKKSLFTSYANASSTPLLGSSNFFLRHFDGAPRAHISSTQSATNLATE